MPGTVRITASRLAEIPGAFGSNGCRTRHPLFPHDNMKNALSMKDETTYDRYPVYRGDDLELTYSPEGSSFRLWAPSAERVRLRLYGAGEGGGPLLTQSMDASSDGTWTAELPGDRKGLFYTFGIFYDGRWLSETPGVRAKAVGVNGDRAAIVDLRETDPEGWEKDLRPPMSSPTDIVIYEMHHRDLSIAPDSGVKHKGKYLALTEEGTRSAEGLATGLDHLKELGVTHVHLLPSFDFGSIDESRLQDGVYDWGYDPKNYFVPEGSYATDPYDPAVRIREFKQMVRSLHRNGIRVVMDAVYNHTHRTEESNFSLTVPGYYYRHEADGSFSDATGCGNETASERAMMRRLIVDAVCYWAEEYHVDGFRFDLMGVHDIGTMNEVRRALDRIDPSILLYGEGWTAARSPLDESLRLSSAPGRGCPGSPCSTTICAMRSEEGGGIRRSRASCRGNPVWTGMSASESSEPRPIFRSVSIPRAIRRRLWGAFGGNDQLRFVSRRPLARRQAPCVGTRRHDRGGARPLRQAGSDRRSDRTGHPLAFCGRGNVADQGRRVQQPRLSRPGQPDRLVFQGGP